ncbi:MAG: Alpha-acetolactate decarboxylase [Candidatus Methanolliviera sp. GoM_asphalt]|nr:MAG: Alpha-acetolactate decarboxylase [Candidatus Methanolliviera sp. GoM_asphalt]
MKINKIVWFFIAILFIASIYGAYTLGTQKEENLLYTPEGLEYQETLTQVSTIGALLNGVYDGGVSFGDLKRYGDFGIGTFNGLDGEMVALDGEFYQIKSDGSVYKVKDSMKTPFANVTFFDGDREVKLDEGMNYEDIRDFIDDMIPTKNIFYAIKIDGTFSYVKTRSVPKQVKPYPPLAEVTKDQSIFEFNDAKGTIVGFRSPSYVGGMNVPGYHLHFITEDRRAGGHLLEVKVKDANATMDYTSDLFMVLPSEDDFYRVDLTNIKEEEVEKVEK